MSGLYNIICYQLQIICLPLHLSFHAKGEASNLFSSTPFQYITVNMLMRGT